MKVEDSHNWALGYPVNKSVTIKAGRYYIDGHGEKRGPMKAEHSHFVDDRGWGFYANGQRMARSGEDHPDHLVVEWVGPAAEGPVRTVTRREIVPGVYGRVEVGKRTFDRIHVMIYRSDGGHKLTAHELRSAAMVLSQIAEALDDA